jgi:chromosomal replication initiation ATPase DnaA
MEQTYFNYNLKPNLNIDDFYVGNSNIFAFNALIRNKIDNNKLLLIGPNKSGKTHLSLIWKNKFDALIYKNNLDEIVNTKKNILVDNLLNNLIEEDIFHLINHCDLNNLKILITSHIPINVYNFNLKDLSSRLKVFLTINIDLPEDDLLINLMIKLFHDKQIIIKNSEIFNYIIKRTDRSYEKIFKLIDKIDQLLLKKNKQLTIPLIKELI